MTPEQLSQTSSPRSALVAEGALDVPGRRPDEVRIERPKSKEHGDYATNVALQLAKRAGIHRASWPSCSPSELKGSEAIAAVDIAGPGFINITVEAGAQGEVARAVVAAGASYGTQAYAGTRINLEFVSANPTGPVHIGGGRWAPVGDSLARIFAARRRRDARVLLQRPRRADRPLLPLARSRAKGEDPGEDGYVGEYLADIV